MEKDILDFIDKKSNKINKEYKKEYDKFVGSKILHSSECLLIIEDVVDNAYKIYIFDIISCDIIDYHRLIDLLHMVTKDDEVKIYIDSFGGSVQTGCMICAAMEDCKAHITTYALDMAFSMGSTIWAFGDTLELFPGAIIMFHNMSTFMYGYLGDIRTDLKIKEDIFDRILEISIKKGILLQEEKDDIINKNKDIYIPYEEMIKRLDRIKEQ